MGKITGFLDYEREELSYRDIEERLKDYKEVTVDPGVEELEELVEQAGRCMDCGTPFCHTIGCPVVNLIPEWNDSIWRGQWKEAYERLDMTNNFPEFTGRICPAPCETACTLSINTAPVTIKQIEHAIIEKAFEEGWVVPCVPENLTGLSVAVVGSGPAGMAAAQQLRRFGHSLTLFEKNRKIGGLMRYGIPDFKMDKRVIDRRLEQMVAEGVIFETGVKIGEDISIKYLREKFDAILLAMGAEQPRDLPVDGREMDGLHFAMDFLRLSNRRVSGESIEGKDIRAEGKNVLVIGGGDTGSDCVGTCNRQKAKAVYQFEIMPKPLEWSNAWNPEWPNWPNILRTSSSHREGCKRDWNIETLGFEGSGGQVSKGYFRRIKWILGKKGERPTTRPVPGSEFSLDIDLVLLAMGFVHVEHGSSIKQIGVALDARGNIKVDNYHTSIPGVFAAGDSHTGASLVVWAINHGRLAAESINKWLS